MQSKMVTVRINKWDDFYKLAAWFLNDTGQWVFRGQEKSEWELKSSLERESEKRKGKAKRKRQFSSLVEFLDWFRNTSTRTNESEQIETFKALTQWDHYMGESKLPYLAAMQHYGFPTRLLDFTHSLFIAVYFAFENMRSRGDRAVWALRLDPVWDYVKTILGIPEEAYDYEVQKRAMGMGEELIGNAKPRYGHGVLPLLTCGNNPRLKAQNGLFLMPFTIDGFFVNLERSLPGGLIPLMVNADKARSGTREFLLDQFLQLKVKQEIVIMKIIFTKGMKKTAEAVCRQMNLTKERLFPDVSFADVKDNVKRRFWYK